MRRYDKCTLLWFGCEQSREMGQQMERDVRIKNCLFFFDNDNMACLYVNAYDPEINELMTMV